MTGKQEDISGEEAGGGETGPPVHKTVDLLAREAGVDRIGDLALRRGLISPDQLADCLRFQVHYPARMLGQILIQKAFITARQFSDLLREQLRRVPLHRKIGRYALQGVLGEGSCGVVFLARDYRLGRKVALKVLRTDSYFYDKRIEQFQSEANNAARLNHPNVVSIHDAGQEGPLCYIAMEPIKGQSISCWARRRRGRWKVICRALEQVARGVQHAHERGVIHRDLKSRNILVDGEGRSRLVDFSLSRVLGEGGNPGEQVNIIGTPAYMSPEQAEGRIEDVDTRSDLFSLGVVMFEALTGSLPFDAGNLGELFRQIREENPAPMPGVPEDLVRICHRALQKNPADRYQDAREISDDLNRYLESMTRPFFRRRFRRVMKRVHAWFGFQSHEKPLLHPVRPSSIL